EHADADADPARCGGACCGRRQHSPIEWVLGKPYAGKPARLSQLAKLDATAGVEAAMKTQAESWRDGRAHARLAPLHAARSRCGARRREMRVHHAPPVTFPAEHHGRARDE